jgi:transposase
MQEHVVPNQVIGIDVSKKKLDVCSILGDRIRKKSFTNTESGFKSLKLWVEKFGVTDPHFCMESTGCYSEAIAEFLYNSGFRVSVVNPLPIKAFRTSKMVHQKTDKSDSEIIAKFCLQNDPALWNPKTRENKELHEINLRIDALNFELNRLTNALESKYLNEVVKKSINEETEFVKKTIKALEFEARRIVENDEHLRSQFDHLTSIKGVGTKMALTILADMPDVNKFESAKQYAAFVGVTPSHFQSGTSVNRKSHISKFGSRRIRKILYMNALVVKNHNKHFADFVNKLEKKGKSAKIIIVAIMRKLMHLFFGMLKKGVSFDEKIAFGD